MSKKRIAASVLLVILAVLLNIALIQYRTPIANQGATLKVTLQSDEKNAIQMFYLPEESSLEDGFKSSLSSSSDYTKVGKTQTLSYTIPGDVQYIRLDLGSGESTTQISDMSIDFNGKTYEISSQLYTDIIDSNDVTTSVDGNNLNIVSADEDPYIVLNTSTWNLPQFIFQNEPQSALILRVVLCLATDVTALILLIFMKQYLYIPLEAWRSRKLILQLSKNDFRTKFAGSYLGTVWAFVQPIVTVVVYWFVFEKGLKAGGINTKAGIDVPFVLWLVAGLIPWFFFQEAWSGGTNALVEYSYLVKKVVFKISILPIVKVVSALFVHAFFIVFTLVLYAAYQYYPDIYTIQILYYSFSLMVFVLGLSYATSAIVVFFRDLSQIVNILLQIGVWMTPIMWNIDSMDLSPVLLQIFKLNPLYYVVAGYRESLITKTWFWENPTLSIYFWVVTILLFGIGTAIFRRSKVHFADVL